VQDSTHEWVEGIAGASLKNKFIETIETAGFVDVEVVDEQPNNDGDEEWRSSLVTSTIRAFKPDR
jgi:predicted glycosyltransferase